MSNATGHDPGVGLFTDDSCTPNIPHVHQHASCSQALPMAYLQAILSSDASIKLAANMHADPRS